MKTYLSDNQAPPQSQIGDALESLAHTIGERKNAGEESYTFRLLTGDLDKLLKKLVEEAHETTLAAKDIQALSGKEYTSECYQQNLDHLRYEAGDVIYHLLVVLERNGISLDELAAELNSRMSDDGIARRGGVLLLKPEHINRGNH